MTTKEKALRFNALLDLWKGQGREWRAREAVKDWSSEELMKLIENTVEFTSNEFTIIYDGNKWKVTYIWHDESHEELKVALFRLYQWVFHEGKAKESAKEGVDHQYLNFYGENYGAEYDDDVTDEDYVEFIPTKKEFTEDHLWVIRDLVAEALDSDIKGGRIETAEEDLEIINVIQDMTGCEEFKSLDQFQRNESDTWAEIKEPEDIPTELYCIDGENTEYGSLDDICSHIEMMNEKDQADMNGSTVIRLIYNPDIKDYETATDWTGNIFVNGNKVSIEVLSGEHLKHIKRIADCAYKAIEDGSYEIDINDILGRPKDKEE